MRELEILGMNPTGRGAWHGFTVTETRPGVRQGWIVTARIDTEEANPLRRYGVLVRMADDMGEYRARYVACLADLATVGGYGYGRSLLRDGAGMNLFIARDGSYGDAIDLLIVDSRHWCNTDYDLLSEWNERTRLDYTDELRANPQITPTEWENK
jgi:hypothetical protein